ncbi:MAG: inorganic pyrophosphatase Ppa [Deltaproteobacteria bacterium]|nr:inorganic pyrophosphatase Ppa [Deltaproteobacteria bacterium]
MTIEKLLEQVKKFEIDVYKTSADFRANTISFTGAPEKHPHDTKKLILITDPFSDTISYYEFNIGDVLGAEELPSLATMEGKSVVIYRIWVRRGSIGILSTPFIVENTREAKP